MFASSIVPPCGRPHEPEVPMISIRSAHRGRSHTMASVIALAVAAILMPALSLAGPWPQRIVRITTASAPGGSVDVVARLVAGRPGGPLPPPILTLHPP